MRSFDDIKRDWKGTEGFFASLTIGATNSYKLDLIYELLVGLHEKYEGQNETVNPVTQVKRDRRLG
jgi:hypothetical protein